MSISFRPINRNVIMDYTSKEPRAYTIAENMLRHAKMKFRLPLND